MVLMRSLSSGVVRLPTLRTGETMIERILVKPFQKSRSANLAANSPCRPRALTRRSSCLAFSLAGLLVAGCKVGPDYKRPEATTIPPAYTGATNVEHRWGSHEAEILDVGFVDADGTERNRFRAGERKPSA